jgi:two-component system NtrC family sensor kinase
MDQSAAAVSTIAKVLPPPSRNQVWLTLIATICVLAGVAWASAFMPSNPTVPLIIPTSPLLLMAAMRLKPLSIGLIAVAHAAALIAFNNASVAAAIVTAIGLATVALIGAKILTRSNFDASLKTAKGLLQFLGVGLAVSATGSAITASLSAFGFAVGLPKIFILCWVADAMGMLLFGPISLLLADQIDRGHWPRDMLFWPMASAIIAYAIYAGLLEPTLARPASYALFPLIIFIAYKASRQATMGAIATTGIIAITCTAQGKGPFAMEALRPDVLALHANLAIFALTGLVVALARQQQRDAESKTHQMLLKLASANRLDALSTLAAGIAHEINQPLTSANAYGRAACRLLDTQNLSNDAHKALDGMIRSNERAAAIVRQFRGYLRSNRQSWLPVNINQTIQDAVALLGPTIKNQRVRMDLDLPDQPLWVMGNATGLQQIIVNLVQNALEALETTQGRPAACINIQARALASGQTMCVSVRDNGGGLSSAIATRLFQPLESERPDGTGLGLAICRSIVELHGGNIAASNRHGGGAEFRVNLPLERA